MKKIFLVLLILISFSCSDSEEIDLCEGIECSNHGNCVVKEAEFALCLCDSNYHAEKLECVKNTQECGVTEHEENKECVSNKKLVDCLAPELPENATKIDSKVEITWNDGNWSIADNCKWSCNINFYKDGDLCKANTQQCEANQHEEESGCVDNTKMVACTDITPTNGVKVDAQVEITWSNGNWSVAQDCDFTCKENYKKIDNKCELIPVSYDFITPQLNEKLTSSSVLVSWNPPVGEVQDLWLDVGPEPYPSEARNDIKNIHLDADFSVTSHTITGLPENGRVLYLSLSYKISDEWLSITRKIIASGEPLNCESTQHEESGTCINNIKTVACTDITPAHGVKIDAQVEITWSNGVWSDASTCDFTCNEGYEKNGNRCINSSNSLTLILHSAGYTTNPNAAPNSLNAFKYCIQKGIIFDTDVVLASDGVFVLSHDGVNSSEGHTTLDELLSYMKNHEPNSFINLEVKYFDYDPSNVATRDLIPILNRINHFGLFNNILIWTRSVEGVNAILTHLDSIGVSNAHIGVWVHNVYTGSNTERVKSLIMQVARNNYRHVDLIGMYENNTYLNGVRDVNPTIKLDMQFSSSSVPTDRINQYKLKGLTHISSDYPEEYLNSGLFN